MSLSVRQIIFADNSAKKEASIKFKINNIPNKYNIPFGTIDASVDFTDRIYPQSGVIEAPEEYVDFEQLYNEYHNK